MENNKELNTFRPMRRKNKEISIEAAKQLLRTSRIAVLAVNGDGGYPYSVPINFLYDEEANKIYFHGSRIGHKTDSIKACDKVCLTVFGKETIKDLDWAPYVQSTILFGRCHLILDQDKAIEKIRKMAGKYYPNETLIDEEIASSGKAVQMFEIEIEHMTGKEIQEI